MPKSSPSLTSLRAELIPNEKNRMLYPLTLQPWYQNVDLVADGLLTIEEAADFLGIGRSLVYELMGSQDLPYCKLGRARRIPKVALKLFAEKG